VFYSLAFVHLDLVCQERLNAMKKIAIFYTVTLGIFWEAAYVVVIIGVGSLFALAIQFIR
jgi:hypothetical protein